MLCTFLYKKILGINLRKKGSASLTGNPKFILESVEILSEHTHWKESVKFNKMEHLFGTDFANICKYLHVLRLELKIVSFQGSRIYKSQVFSSCLCK